MKRILIVAGIHGDEPSGPHAALSALLDPVFKKRIARAGVVFNIVPLANPSGTMRGTRKTINGHDVNRCFSDEPQHNEPFECTAFRNFLKNIRQPYDLLLSLHEDPGYDAFYLYDAECGRTSPLIQNIFSIITKHGVRRYTGLDEPELGGGIIRGGYANVSANASRTLPTLEEYALRNGYAKKTLTPEIPGKLPLAKKIKLAIELVKTAVGSV